MILSRKALNRIGESKHSCRVPTVVLNQSPVLPLNKTELLVLLYRFYGLYDASIYVVLFYSYPKGFVPDSVKIAFFKSMMTT